MKIENWRIEELTGYKPITSFYTDFSIADRFGTTAIQDTYNRAFKEWQHDYRYITELAMVLNWRFDFISIGMFIALMNLPLFVISGFKIGKKFMV